jgi:hypothetical protein
VTGVDCWLVDSGAGEAVQPPIVTAATAIATATRQRLRHVTDAPGLAGPCAVVPASATRTGYEP